MTSTRLAVLLCALFIAGCTPTESGTSPSADPAPELPPEALQCQTSRRVVALLDMTGSYTSAPRGRDRVADIIAQEACPGDEIFVRRITDESYQTEAHIMTASFAAIPAAPEAPTNGNPIFQRRWEAEMTQWRTLYSQHRQEAFRVATTLHEEPILEAPYSDYYGAFMKAEELLGHTPAGAAPVLVVAGDLHDTVGRKGEADLSGVAVVVLAFEAEDALVARERRQFWEEWFQASQVSSLTFYDMAEPVTSVLPVNAVAPDPGAPSTGL